MTKVLVAVVAFEVIVFGLAIFVMIQVSQVPVGLAVGLCVGAALLAVLSAATLRRPLGQLLGHLTQLVAVLLGLATSAMFVMGGFFALLWLVTFVLGKRLDQQGVTGSR
ncbi:DUF4233 domain-containing protein [Desertihabitans brevis]|uniref:DUF4233 domain-containing protein n=1 Tax=Desertihabitans brevis TaxID=2268447 RepID=A0A367YQ75_9ACTN|nr:DUF4233 domain-containing protein [Desertihabitans brevis]RCK67930.1 DUF4233 domain-containing protein [Desertihabitans brevis]